MEKAEIRRIEKELKQVRTDIKDLQEKERRLETALAMLKEKRR